MTLHANSTAYFETFETQLNAQLEAQKADSTARLETLETNLHEYHTALVENIASTFKSVKQKIASLEEWASSSTDAFSV